MGRKISKYILLLTAGLILPFNFSEAQSFKNVVFLGGNWFDGNRFVEKDAFYSIDGVFSSIKPATIDTTIILTDKYIVPPFGDAHTHMLSTPYSSNFDQEYLKAGIIYVMVLNDAYSQSKDLKSAFKSKNTIDVEYSHGGITSTGSHPQWIYEMVELRYFDKEIDAKADSIIRASRILENNAYWFIDSETDLEEKWSNFLNQNPDIVKIFLLDSEIGKKKNDMGAGRFGHGLEPDIVKLVVDSAKANNLRIFAHIKSAKDASLALKSGVDGFAHLPDMRPLSEVGDQYSNSVELTDIFIKEAGKKKLIVIPTVAITELNNHVSDNLLETAREIQKRQLKKLYEAGAIIALGADAWMQTSETEVFYMYEHGYFANLELLKIWCEMTPRAIFPNRKIGRLEDGFEASFVVVNENPISNFETLKSIQLVFKQGINLFKQSH